MKRRTFAAPLGIALSLAFFGLLAQGAVPDVPTGQWLPGPALAQPRTGAVSVALDDGRVLVIGGRTSQGPVDTVEVLNADGSIHMGAPLLQPRTGHSAVALSNGLVLVSGGTTVVQGNSGANEVVTASAELYDPAANAWMPWWPLQVARSGHTATVLPDGRILVAGGTGAQGVLDSLEVFDPVTMEFASAGILSAPRSHHAATLAGKTQVLLAGGRNDAGVLATADLVDVNTGAVAQVALTVARADTTATTLLDGRIFIAGGSDGANDLASTEVIDPVAGISMPAASMASPRRGHESLLLPDNATVLVTGGTNGGAVVTSAELYVPWNDAFIPTGQPAIPRAEGVLSAVDEGVTLLAGGRAADGSAVTQGELYGFATVRTDKDDYAPGTPVVITGSGWQPGETVTLTLQEVDPQHGDRTLSAIADASGRILNASFAPEEHDLGVRFYLTARGAGAQARTTFTDGTARIDSVSVSPFSPNQPSSLGIKDTTDIVGQNQGGGNITSFSIRIRRLSDPSVIIRTFTVGPLAGNTTAAPVTWDGKDSSNAFVADGIYLARAVDGTTENTAGNAIKTIVVDNTNPVVTLLAPADNDFRRTAVDFEANPIDATGTDKVEFYVDAALVGTDTNSGGGWKVTNISLPEGNHTWFAKAFDAAGNNATSATRTVRVDLTDPAVSVDPVSNGVVNGPLTITGTATDAPAISGYGFAAVQVTITGPAGTVGSAVNTGTNFSTWSFVFSPAAGGNYSVQARATDQAGNFTNSSTRSFTVSADSTPPVISPNVIGTLGTNGWYISNVTVSWSVTDSESTVSNQTGCATTNITADTAGTILTCSATSAGGTASQSVTIKRDASGPTAGLSVTAGTTGANGWYTSDVTVSTSGSDPISGPVTCTPIQTQTTETSGAVFNGSCTNAAGLTTNAAPFTVKLDKTGPSATLMVTGGTAGANGWYTSDVTVSTTGTDSISSPVTCTADQLQTAETTGTAFNGSCTNDAGLTTDAPALTVQLDKTAPTGVALAVTSGTAGANGWYTSDVTVSTSGTDSISGVTCTPDTVLNSDTPGQVVDGSCTNGAGLSTDATALTIKLDKTGPSATLAVSAGSAGANGWYTSDVTVSTTGTDSVSSPVTCTADQFQTTETMGVSFIGSCTNDAGLTTNASSLMVKLDKTAPTGVALAVTSGTAGANGWYTSDVTVSTSGTDAISGAACTPDSVLSAETPGTPVNGSCTNGAGLTTDATALTIKLDKTGPSATLAVTGGTPGSNGWYTSNVTVSTSGTDSISNPVTCTAAQAQTTETTGTAFNSSCMNDAGLTTNATPLNVKLDKTGPTGVALSVTSGTLGTNNWYVTNVTITTSGADSISAPVTCSGPQSQTTDTTGTAFSGSCTNDAGLTTSTAPLTIKRDATAPTLSPSVSPNPVLLNGSATASPAAADSTSGIATATCPTAAASSVGTFSVTCTATDNAGNSSTADASYSVQYASGGYCLGQPGHQILQPVNADGSSVFKKGSTVPAKFRVCDANGASVGLAGVVTSFRLIQTFNGTVAEVDEPVISTTPDTAFRWSASDQQWIFNMNTKGLIANTTYVFRITLNDPGTPIDFRIGLK